MLNLCLLTIFQQMEKGLAVPPQNMIDSCRLNHISAQRERWGAASLGCAKLVSVNSISAEGVNYIQHRNLTCVC